MLVSEVGYSFMKKKKSKNETHSIVTVASAVHGVVMTVVLNCDGSDTLVFMDVTTLVPRPQPLQATDTQSTPVGYIIKWIL